MQPDQIAGLLTATGLVIGALATLLGSIAAVVKAARAPKSESPAPQLGLTATFTADDIDYRAYLDMKERAERAEKALSDYLDDRRRAAPEEETRPT